MIVSDEGVFSASPGPPFFACQNLVKHGNYLYRQNIRFATAEVAQVFLLIFQRIKPSAHQRSHHESKSGHWTN